MEGEISSILPTEVTTGRGLPASSEQGDERERAELQRIIESTRPFFEETMERYGNKTIQFSVQSPDIRMLKPEDYKEITGEEMPVWLRLFGAGTGAVEEYVSIPLGVLNYIPEGDKRILAFRSQTNGKNFTIEVEGNNATVTGEAPLGEIVNGLGSLFDAQGKPLVRRDACKIARAYDPAYYNLDINGNPKASPESDDSSKGQRQLKDNAAVVPSEEALISRMRTSFSTKEIEGNTSLPEQPQPPDGTH